MVPLLDALVEKLSGLDVFTQASIEGIYHDYSLASRIGLGDLVHPTRLAISGVSFGPGLFELMEALGKEIVIRRIKTAAIKIKEIQV
jgi:glutamyl-tRNA synthetase